MQKITNSILLFDVDGTLTPSRQKITPQLLQHLHTLKQQILIGFVGGSNLEKQKEQVNENILNLFDYSFPENGLSFYKNENLIEQTKILNFLGEEKVQEIINETLHYFSKLVLPFKRGTFIELRDSMINVCPCGRSCSKEERNAFFEYDKTNKIRINYVNHMKSKFKDIKFSIGGQISVDVFPMGWDKTFCLKYLKRDGIENIYFFGDMVEEDQNDYEIFWCGDVEGVYSEGPEDTVRKSLEVLEGIKKGGGV